MQHYPMLKITDSETADYLYRKLPREVIEAHTKNDGSRFIQLEEYGIKFNYGIEIAAKTIETLAINFLSLWRGGNEDKGILEIILNGVLHEIVSDEND